MSSTSGRARPFTMVVGVDFSELSDRAVASALTLARLAGQGNVHLVYVLTLPFASSELAVLPDPDELIARAHERVAALVAKESLPSGTALSIHVEVGVPHAVINDVARATGADLILVGTHGRSGFERAVFGSVAENVTRHAPCSVLAVRPREPTAEEQIEPPCPECVKAAAAGDPAHLRCARHSRHPIHAHTYSQLPDTFGIGSMSLRVP